MKRNLNGMTVEQNSKDGMFNATSFLKQYSNISKTRKDVSDFLTLKKTKEFIEAISDSENIDTRKVVLVKKGGKVKNQGTLMHPYLFIDFAMWLNPKFKVKVIKFVYDELIQNRNLAGNNYKLLSASGVKLKGYNFQEVATAMQYIIFGNKGKDLRQVATNEQLVELNELQTKLSFAIDMGYIKSYQNLLSELRKIWRNKNQPF